MELKQTFHAPDLPAWRQWLEQNHASESEVWLIYTKVKTGQPCIKYEESVEEALCFGWVDSLIQRINEDRYARKFTPRRDSSAWSELNKRRVHKVIAQGRMTPAGLAKITFPLDEPLTSSAPRVVVIPGWLAEGLQGNPLAWKNFQQLPPSHQKRYIAWLSSAKRLETRQKNLSKAIEMLVHDQRLEMNTRTGK
jgi:uncharacterized protein YdeI (YjbR/CyaY-like superfamily)